ncbi:MAG: bifunctional DNA-formamidopyrimidine glycosylase/DNA-(apurinic or apyrimidinic site) lyase [Thermodesulfobacteriota bacterium]
MPELPEVETVVRGLRTAVTGKVLAGVVCRYTKINRDNPRGWRRMLTGHRFLTVRRRGKNILMDLSGGLTLWVHLKMTGHFYFADLDTPPGPHDLVLFDLKGEDRQLRYQDTRRFGRVRLFLTNTVMEQKGLADLGPEPLEITRPDFVARMNRTGRMIKPALLDQRFLAGIGNIYADESLFRAKIHPRAQTNGISARKVNALYDAIRDVLTAAIANMGTTVDTFAGVEGEFGGFQSYLQAYGREGEPCLNCGGTIRREVIGSRSAHYCPRCQRV